MFVCLHLLIAHLPEPHLGFLLSDLPEVVSYVGADCSAEWLHYLRRSQAEAHQTTCDRLQEALGITVTELETAKAHLASQTWSPALVANRLDELLLERTSMREISAGPALATALGSAAAPDPATATMRAHMAADDWPPRLRDSGLAGAAAMVPRLRRELHWSAPPCLPRACKLCEASYPASDALQWHLRCVHGGDQRAREALLCLENEKPHYVTPAEKRRIIHTFDHRYS